jgi:DNA-binding NtrC family response regulator
MAIPVLVVSASNDLAARALAIGAADYIQKPFDLEQLEQKLERVMGQTHTARHAYRSDEAVE